MENGRIILRRWEESDAEAMFRYASDPDIGIRAGWEPHKSIKESLEIIRTVFSIETTWAIVLKETNEPIGAIGYCNPEGSGIPARDGEPLIGYWIGKPYWNMGICTEALKMVLDYDKSILSFISGHYVDNIASGKVMQKCGFIPTGEKTTDQTGKEIRVLRFCRK